MKSILKRNFSYLAVAQKIFSVLIGFGYNCTKYPNIKTIAFEFHYYVQQHDSRQWIEYSRHVIRKCVISILSKDHDYCSGVTTLAFLDDIFLTTIPPKIFVCSSLIVITWRYSD